MSRAASWTLRDEDADVARELDSLLVAYEEVLGRRCSRGLSAGMTLDYGLTGRQPGRQVRAVLRCRPPFHGLLAVEQRDPCAGLGQDDDQAEAVGRAGPQEV